jgi:hypothetical protein
MQVQSNQSTINPYSLTPLGLVERYIDKAHPNNQPSSKKNAAGNEAK